MARRRVLLLPGSANPKGSTKYRLAYCLIRERAGALGCDFGEVTYPGWGDASGPMLNYPSAFQAAMRHFRAFRPDWIIGRSLGCHVAVGILGSGDPSVAKCRGAVLWGPSLSADIKRVFPSKAQQKRAIKRYANADTFLADGFFDSIPPLERSIAGAAGNLRIARGSEDTDNTAKTLSVLKSAHSTSQPSFRVETVKIQGLGHHVTGDEDSVAVERYLNCLFQPFNK